jgi:hypothetical protein
MWAPQLSAVHAERERALLVVARVHAQDPKLSEVIDRVLARRWPGWIPTRMVDMALHPAGVYCKNVRCCPCCADHLLSAS